MKKVFGYLIGVLAFLVCLAVDQATKIEAVIHLKGTKGISLLPNVFHLQYLENHGAAFGVLQDQRGFLLVFTVIILGIIGFIYYKLPDEKHYLPLRLIGVLIGAGAVGNMLDRIFRGYVVDFLYFKLIDFPIFNVADCYVVIAAVMAFFLICFYYKDSDFDFIKKDGKKKEK